MKKPTLTFLLAAAACPVWSAEPSAPTLDALVACSTNPDISSRLACFDREIAPLAAARARAATTPAATVAPPPANPVQTESAATPRHPDAAASSFGAENLSVPLDSVKAQILHAHITGLKAAGSGWFLVTLDNGQVWRHEDAFLGGYLKEGEEVTITKATLGVYRLTRDAGKAKNWIRVTRIR